MEEIAGLDPRREEEEGKRRVCLFGRGKKKRDRTTNPGERKKGLWNEHPFGKRERRKKGRINYHALIKKRRRHTGSNPAPEKTPSFKSERGEGPSLKGTV